VLDALWSASDALRPTLSRYLHRKAALVHKPRLDWSDLSAPLPAAGQPPVTWEQAQALVVDSFAEVHPELGAFARQALEARWVDAEARDGKRAGAFCAPFPRSEQSRVFLTWADTLDAALTLAHELGHAFHSHVLFAEPAARRDVTSALAETASTFAEAVLRNAALRHASSDAVRAFVLDQQLQAGTVFLMNIRARFDFERRLFALRRQGAFDPDVLSAEMVACQRAAYDDALGEYDPLFWANKLHFYITRTPFYNWPYTFGYLFSGAVYARAVAEGPSFWPTYTELLRRTGYEDTETLGREVLGEDLTDPGFWERAAAPLLADLEQFLALTASGAGVQSPP
jgi:oligoendopeptidase F